MPRIDDPVAIRHPAMPGEVVVIPRRALASRARNGWVEAKSPAAKAAVEQASPEGDPPTPSKEES